MNSEVEYKILSIKIKIDVANAAVLEASPDFNYL